MSLDGWSGEDRASDVLDSGGEREPLTPAARRRLRLGGVVIIVAVAAVAGGLEVQERRDVAAEERRLAGLLQLSAPHGPWEIFVAADRPFPRSAVVLNMKIPVRNDGPRDVTVTRASAGGFVLLLAPVPLPAQAAVELVMQQRVHCTADTQPPSEATLSPWAAPGPLQVTARTSRGTRTITIARPPYDPAHAARVCALLRNNPPVDDADATSVALAPTTAGGYVLDSRAGG